MAGSIREMSSEMGDNHGNFDLFELDSSIRINTRTLPSEIVRTVLVSAIKNHC